MIQTHTVDYPSLKHTLAVALNLKSESAAPYGKRCYTGTLSRAKSHLRTGFQ